MMTSQTPVLPDVFTDPASGQRINLLDYKARNLRASWLMALVTMALLSAIAYLLATVTGVGYRRRVLLALVPRTVAALWQGG